MSLESAKMFSLKDKIEAQAKASEAKPAKVEKKEVKAVKVKKNEK